MIVGDGDGDDDDDGDDGDDDDDNDDDDFINKIRIYQVLENRMEQFEQKRLLFADIEKHDREKEKEDGEKGQEKQPEKTTEKDTSFPSSSSSVLIPLTGRKVNLVIKFLVS